MITAKTGELRDSTAVAGDWSALRQRVRQDGYVFCRGVLPGERVRAVGHACLALLQADGWLENGSSPEVAAVAQPPRRTDAAGALGDPGYRSVLMSEAFNRLPFEPAVRALMTNIMGPNTFCYPVKFARVVYPAAMVPAHGGRYVHQDVLAVGVQDMFTMWTPLMPIPVELGGLALRPGSHRAGLVRPRLFDPSEPGWLTADYEPGDVLVFHCCTVHAALPNHTDRLRLSGEYRWQLADQHAPARMIFGPSPANRDGRGAGARAQRPNLAVGGGTRNAELFSRRFGRTSWWRPVPAQVKTAPMEPARQLSGLGRSRFVDLPPDWNRDATPLAMGPH